MHDANNDSLTTEPNRENVLQLILHINFIFASFTVHGSSLALAVRETLHQCQRIHTANE